MDAHPNQQIFLSNEGNKQQFISLLSRHLEADGQVIRTSTGDADTLIVAHALRYTSQGKVVNVVTEDTDILVLLMHHWKDRMADVYFRSESNKKQPKLWRIHDLVTKAGNLVTSNLLFIHAWSGCDTTSASMAMVKLFYLRS